MAAEGNADSGSGGGLLGAAGDLFQIPTMGEALSGIGAVASDIGNYVQAGYSKQGAEDEQAAYEKAAGLAGENAAISQGSTQIQAQQEQRKINMTLGKQQAEVEAAGFNAGSGSAGMLMQASAEQGALATSLIRSQGAIQTTSYQQQEAAYTGQAQAAGVAAQAAGAKQVGSIFSGVLSVASMFL